MEIKRSQNSPHFMLKRVEINGKTLFSISDKMHRVKDKIMHIKPHNGVIITFPSDKHNMTKIGFYHESIELRKSFWGRICSYILGPKIVRVQKGSIDVHKDIEERVLFGKVVSLISD